MPLSQITNSRAVEVAAAADVMRAIEPGAIATYAALDAAIGDDCRRRRHIIERAREILRDEGYVFVAEANVGYRRLFDTEIATHIPAMRSNRIRRQAKTGLSELAAIRTPDCLPETERLRYAVGGAILGAMLCVAGAKARKAITDIASRRQTSSLPLDETLAALRNIG